MTSCTKSKRTSSPDAPAKCRDVENASAFETRSAPNLARCYPRSFAFYLGNPFPRFWHEFNRLPAHVQCLAREKFQLWLCDPFHPSMQFKPLLGNVWSVRIGDHYRAVAQKHGDLIVWFWIATHEDCNNFSGSVSPEPPELGSGNLGAGSNLNI